MRPIEVILARSTLLLILCSIDFAFLLGSYGVLRALHITVDWVTWFCGGVIIIWSMGVCLELLLPGHVPGWLDPGGNFVGALSFFVAVYTAGQWLTRQWFLRTKKWIGKSLVQASKNTLMFLRKHHIFFGWVVVAGAVAHMLFFFPFLSRINYYEEVTGFIAIGILALIVLLGAWLWIESSLRKRRMPKAIHALHSALTIAFFVVLFLHI